MTDERPAFRLESFEYVRTSAEAAVVRLTWSFAAGGMDRADPVRLVVDDGRAVLEVSPLPESDGASAISAEGGPLRAAFSVPLDVLVDEHARYMLASGAGWEVDLPPPVESDAPGRPSAIDAQTEDAAASLEQPARDGDGLPPLGRKSADVWAALSTAHAEVDAERELLATIERELRARTESQRGGRMALERRSDELRALGERSSAQRTGHENARDAIFDRLRSEAARGAREVAELEQRIAEIRNALSVHLGADPDRSPGGTGAEMAVVKRSWASSQRLEVPLAQLAHFHFTTSAGIGKGAPTRPILAASMPCTAIPDDLDFDHACPSNGRPHSVEVLIFKSRNDDETYARMEALAEEP